MCPLYMQNYEIRWTVGWGKWYLHPLHTPPEHTNIHTPQPMFSLAHKVKGFADDLGILPSKREHKNN